MSRKLYSVTLDLLAEGDYASLKERLRTLGAHQVLADRWARCAALTTPVSWKTVLRQLIDEGDRVHGELLSWVFGFDSMPGCAMSSSFSFM